MKMNNFDPDRRIILEAITTERERLIWDNKIAEQKGEKIPFSGWYFGELRDNLMEMLEEGRLGK